MEEAITPDEGQKPEEAKGLRKQLEASLEREKGYRTQLLSTAYADLDLDPKTGLGKAIAKEYDGEASAEALAAFAKAEYDYVYTKPEAAPELNPQAEVIAQAQAALDQAGQTAGSVPVAPTEGDTLAKAEAEGDYATTMAIKSQQVAEALTRR